MKKKQAKPQRQAELSRRGAAAAANATRGMSRILTPNNRVYDRATADQDRHDAILATIDTTWADW